MAFRKNVRIVPICDFVGFTLNSSSSGLSRGSSRFLALDLDGVLRWRMAALSQVAYDGMEALELKVPDGIRVIYPLDWCLGCWVNYRGDRRMCRATDPKL